jgi:hypothetical protein
MYFSGSQWLGAIILDVLFRVLFSIATGSLLFMPFAPAFSVIHYGFLGAASAFTTSHNIRPRYSIPLTILTANILFFVIFVGFLVSGTKAGRATRCLVESDQCYWINGKITELGMWALAQDGIIQIAINLIPLLIVWSLNIRPRQPGTGHSPEQERRAQ